MSFPETRLTLVQRLATRGSEQDWCDFLQDYWGPVCRFAMRWGAQSVDEAEDIASQVFQVLFEDRLLVRWVSNRSAKLRSLLCAVTRKLMANQRRVQENRDRLSPEVVRHLQETTQDDSSTNDPFYAAWAEELVQRAVERLTTEFFSQNKGDYIRVLHGRLCDGLTIAEVSEALEIERSNVDYFYRRSKQRLSQVLESCVREHLDRYADDEGLDAEFDREWYTLGDYLAANGGLEIAIQRAFDTLSRVQSSTQDSQALEQTRTRLIAMLRESEQRRSAPEAE